MKDYIFEFTNDPGYRDEKCKERSLRLVPTMRPGKDKKEALSPEDAYPIAIDEAFDNIMFGVSNICVNTFLTKYGGGVLIEPPPADVQSRSVASGNAWDADQETLDYTVKKSSMSKSRRIKNKLKGRKKRVNKREAVVRKTAKKWAHTHHFKRRKPGMQHALTIVEAVFGMEGKDMITGGE